ncbi:MAG: 4-hydroxybenzoate octaprenyltransferase [Gammaproteobacteria bacterium]|nr:4-hydroxybenzoate octaprenyltransferase [Gammaproteobacteria bacterium]
MSSFVGKLGAYARLMRWHRPIGALLLLWPMLWALWIAASGLPDYDVLLIFVLGVWVMRSAGCVINDFADREFDPQVRRTRDRPLATGDVTPTEALTLFGGLLALAFMLVLFTNRLTIMLSFGGAALAATYPFMKRYTYLPQVVLGAAFGWAVPMAWAAQTNTLTPVAWLIFIATVIWAVIYDTQYAMVDREDDLNAGVKSTAILFGEQDRLMIGVFQMLMLCDLLLVGLRAELGGLYYLSLVIACGFGIYQQWLIRKREPAACFAAFMNNNWLGGCVFLGIVADIASRSAG